MASLRMSLLKAWISLTKLSESHVSFVMQAFKDFLKSNSGIKKVKSLLVLKLDLYPLVASVSVYVSKPIRVRLNSIRMKPMNFLKAPDKGEMGSLLLTLSDQTINGSPESRHSFRPLMILPSISSTSSTW